MVIAQNQSVSPRGLFNLNSYDTMVNDGATYHKHECQLSIVLETFVSESLSMRVRVSPSSLDLESCSGPNKHCKYNLILARWTSHDSGPSNTHPRHNVQKFFKTACVLQRVKLWYSCHNTVMSYTFLNLKIFKTADNVLEFCLMLNSV